MDELIENSMCAPASRLKKKTLTNAKVPRKKMLYLKPGLPLFSVVLRLLFHGSLKFVCKNRVNA